MFYFIRKEPYINSHKTYCISAFEAGRYQNPSPSAEIGEEADKRFLLLCVDNQLFRFCGKYNLLKNSPI